MTKTSKTTLRSFAAIAASTFALNAMPASPLTCAAESDATKYKDQMCRTPEAEKAHQAIQRLVAPSYPVSKPACKV